MKKMLTLADILLLTVLTLAASDAQAQTPWFGVHGSAVFPGGYLQDVASDGYGGGFGVGALVAPNILVKGMVGYYDFGSKNIAGEADINGAYVPLEIGSNFYFRPLQFFRPYLTLHGGWFVASGDFRDSDFGTGGGIGLEIPFGNSGLAFQIEPNYNIVFGSNNNRYECDYGYCRDVSSENYEYWTIDFGLTFNIRPPSPADQLQLEPPRR